MGSDQCFKRFDLQIDYTEKDVELGRGVRGC